MTRDRRKLLIPYSVIFCAMLPCLFVSLLHGPHHAAFGLAFCVLGLINSWLYIQFNIKHHRQPDTLIHLFPEPVETIKERS